MGRPIIGLDGPRSFGRLTVVKLAGPTRWDTRTLREMVAASLRIAALTPIVRGHHLRAGARGPAAAPIASAVAKACTTHGMFTATREYRIWSSMVQRCHNPNTPLLARYGAKGLIVGSLVAHVPAVLCGHGTMPHELLAGSYRQREGLRPAQLADGQTSSSRNRKPQPVQLD